MIKFFFSQGRVFLFAAALTVASASAQETQGLIYAIKTVSVAASVVQEIIDKIHVEEGAEVKEGDILIELRNDREELALEEGKRLVENAEFNAQGYEALAKDKFGSKVEALKAKTELALARIRLDAAKVALAEKTIRAPIDGIVVKKYKEAGEAVERVEKLIDLVNIDQVYAQFYLDPKFMQTLSVGQEITVKVAAPMNSSVTGAIDFIDPRIDAGSGLFRIKVLIDNPGRKIKAGMRALANFSTRT